MATTWILIFLHLASPLYTRAYCGLKKYKKFSGTVQHDYKLIECVKMTSLCVSFTIRSSSSRERGSNRDRSDRNRDRFDRFDRSEGREANQVTKRSFSRESQERGGRGGDGRSSTESVRRVASMTDSRDRGSRDRGSRDRGSRDRGSRDKGSDFVPGMK